jgi:hypothetical protein
MLRCLVVVALLAGAACKERGPAALDAAAPAPAPSADARPSMAQAGGPDAAAARRDGGAAAVTTPPAGKSVGVPACDEYLAKMEACIARLSPESAEPVAAAMADSRKAWQETATTEEGRAALVAACAAALDAAKTAATAMGCSW